ncbi:MAG TPA: YncE family protein [Acidobacteriaceae bacterium]|nr:YncE family protein [Acidobacteriaceae bacterium]
MRPAFRSAALFLGILAAVTAPQLPAQTHWSVTNTFHIGGEGAWDYVTADPATHRLFVTRSTHTIVVDENTGKVLGDIPGQVRSHGVAIVPKLNRGFITDGGGKGAIVVFDLKTYATLGKIPAMPDADGIIYDAKQDRVLAVSGDGNTLMVIDPAMDPNGKMAPPIQLGGAPEFLATDGSGKVFVNLEDKDMVAVVDLKTRSVVHRWPVAPAGHPVGMSIDPAQHLIFIGCRKPQMLVVMNTETGKVEASLPIGAGVDATAFYNGQAFASTGDGAITVAGRQNGTWAVVETVKTPVGARTMTIDPASHLALLPTAEMEPATGGGRPRPKPGTFMIVVVAPK